MIDDYVSHSDARIKAAAGPICPYRSVAIDRKLRELGHTAQRTLDGRRIVSVITIPLRAVEKAWA